jgi:23S rRNA (adenine-N6)-dimethyltransferase
VAVRRARAARRPAGQHFLRSSAVARALVDDAGISPGDLALDIGAGTGILAAELAARGARVLAVEDDPRLVAELRRRFANSSAVQVVHQDARRLAWPAEQFSVVANLPFGAGSAILHRLLDDPRVELANAELVLQWEAAAKRAAVWPSTLLGAYWGAWYELRLTRRLPPSAFAPPPAVAAGVLRVERRPHPLVPAECAGAYRRLLALAFGESVPLRRSLAEALPPRALKRQALELGFAPDARARDLDPRQWAALFRAVRRCR